MPKLPWIGCELLRLEYDFQMRTAILHLHEGDCVDMTSAIELVRNIDKNARTIRTVAGTKEDTRYGRGTDGDWTASLPG
jgi:hypothetical protein